MNEIKLKFTEIKSCSVTKIYIDGKFVGEVDEVDFSAEAREQFWKILREIAKSQGAVFKVQG